uniref:Gamma-glutamylcyclotransferase family protein n=1 Tax=Timspurckia oligopyrenoides TaxID=708627 RepID=A0A7S1EQ58_9RHOD|mmetsp:Transcript_11209/g.20249  ORF Transcript_11209/g.20249 Transcript_11209/m.20249 type:complete len:168 (+) Transcript_11209:74-577(+)
MVPYLFLYGTLKQGFPNASSLPLCLHAQFCGNASTEKPMRLVLSPQSAYSIPFLLPDEKHGSRTQVRGEVYFLAGLSKSEVDSTLKFLDEFEAVQNGLYDRVEIDVRLENQESKSDVHKAWTYVRSYNDGPEWIREWNVSKLAKLEYFSEYSKEQSQLYVPRNQRNS